MSNTEKESELKAISSYLNDFASPHEPGHWSSLEEKGKEFLGTSGQTKKGLQLVPDIPTRSIILQGVHDDIGHWDFKSTYEFIAS